MDRNILTLLVTPIRHDLAVSDTEMGLLLGPVFAYMSRNRKTFVTIYLADTCVAMIAFGWFAWLPSYSSASSPWPRPTPAWPSAPSAHPSFPSYCRSSVLGIPPAFLEFPFDSPPAYAALRALVPLNQLLFGTDFPYGSIAESKAGLVALALQGDDANALL